MIRVYLALIIWLPLYIIVGCIYYLIEKSDYFLKTKIIEKHRVSLYKYFGYLARSFIYLIGIKIDKSKIDGLEDIPSVIVSNHQSNIDPWLIYGLLPVKSFSIVAKKTISNIPLMKTFGKILGGHYIDRANSKEALKTLIKASASIKEGVPFVIFPEGTRSKSDTIGSIKHGYTIPVKRHKVPIQVIRELGGYKSLEKRKLFTWRVEMKFEYLGKIEYNDIDFKTIDAKIAEMLGGK
jgi:1-acyl-sn-glycerol-3-phosphate acyltransferase